ncbi:hypothetical protein N7510_009874 [Penicillium lagena]|uniref:uncharacterized protein n=1 Tax=Penicillium lagena TaxID=94218 RepID=UPI00254225F3|nr:uncharacterized protein N7510_009874 [Penicillium lagena]KAJ5604720.1 hypothetical protein N7510_009874 [Penicillium lagena]
MSPKQYICPAETTPHIATILGFPSPCSTLPGLYERTCSEIVDLAGTLAPFEPVRLHVRPEIQARAQQMVNERMNNNDSAPHKTQITLVPCATNHCWVRDTGPVYVRGADDGKRYAIDFRFCEWGVKTDEEIYQSRVGETEPELGDEWPVMGEEAMSENTAFAERVLELENQISKSNQVQRIASPIRLEGGGIEIDGEGTFMATESSIVGGKRNPGMSRTEIETHLRQLLGVTHFIWFPGRAGLDITDCHVDAEARFVKPGVVVLSKPHPSVDQVYHDMYEEMREVLRTTKDAKGRTIEVHDIEDPDPVLVRGNLPGEEKVPAAAYVNFYFANGVLVAPVFGDPVADAKAVQTLRDLVPEREIRTVSVNALPRTGGVLHCVTQQVM